MFNVLTGVFVESSLKVAEKTKLDEFSRHMRHVFEDAAEDGRMTREDFTACLDDNRDYMRDMGIEITDVNVLSKFLDNDSGIIDTKEVLAGLARLRSGARFIDILTLLHEVGEQRELILKLDPDPTLLQTAPQAPQGQPMCLPLNSPRA